ncbi:MAG: hypothetical protein ACOH1E_09735 [Brevundimonas sp.]
MRRIAVLILGCLAAGMAAGLVGAAILMTIWGSDGKSPTSWLGGLVVFSTIITLYGIVASLTLGMFAHALLTRLGRTTWLAYLLAGLTAGALGGLLFGGLGQIGFFGVGLGAGAAGALAFRAIVRPAIKRTTAEATTIT